ncbi:hypothetical protein HNR34_002954 [Geobacillus subterraneus]
MTTIFIITFSLSNKMGKGHGHEHQDVLKQTLKPFCPSFVYMNGSPTLYGERTTRKGAYGRLKKTFH